MSIFLSNFVQVAQGPRNKPVPPMLNDVISIPLGGGHDHHLGKAGPHRRRHGRIAGRLLDAGAEERGSDAHSAPVEQDRRMAALIGIDVNRTVSLTFVIGGALAAVAGMMFMTYYGVVNFSDGFTPGVKAFTAAVLGGIGSLPGRGHRRIVDRTDRDHVVGIFFDRLQRRRRLLHSCRRADFHAVRPARPARRREGLNP